MASSCIISHLNYISPAVTIKTLYEMTIGLSLKSREQPTTGALKMLDVKMTDVKMQDMKMQE